MFDEVGKKSFDERERKELAFWQDERIFEQSLKIRKDSKPFIFYDGPPFATGLPHYGHLLAGTIKDVIPRYKTMKGYYVSRRFGWDCHGLPVENEIEKDHGLSGAKSIEEFGIANFNEECRKIVLRYTEEWKRTVLRMGRWVDLENTYRTMDPEFMESVWWVFKQLYEKGLVYEGFKVMPFSAKLGTPLSNFEATQNYKEVDDPSLTVMFALKDEPDTHFLAWTTTPWTLVSNLALMVAPEIEYVKIKHHESGKQLILAKARVGAYYPDRESYTVEESFPGSKLIGMGYQPLFDYFVDEAAEGAFRVILAEDTVSTEEGTGIVHTAPAFGEVDFYACRHAGIEPVCPVDNNGKFTESVPDYAGLFVKDADKEIIKHLKGEGKVLRNERCRHRYPFCWRSDTPLIYKAVTTWFIAVEKIKDKLLRANENVHWAPDFIKSGRFGKWLENARDWAVSRNRYWGTPIPLWRAEDGEILVIGSKEELERLSDVKIDDLHRHFIDEIAIEKNGKIFRRVPEVFDCWFESGSVPYAQSHYPFEHSDNFKSMFPADFIAEGIDQTRGWFYTLTVLGAALFDQPAFKNVIVNGIILAEDGAKMSKRLKNYPVPSEVIHRYGADAVRLYMLNSPASRADDLRFSERGVELVLRQVLIPFWNAYTFFITYARIYDWKPKEAAPEAEIDKWILSKLNELIEDVEEGLNRYDLTRAVKPFVGFIGQLTNWYIRRSRRRFWEEEETVDRNQAFSTLYRVLLDLSKIAAPFVPFISEAMYRNLKTEKMAASVHLCDFPSYNESLRDKRLEETMAAVQTTVSLGHALRKEHKFKVRQPLPKAYVITTDERLFGFLESERHLIADELNVKEVELSAEEEQFVRLQAKPNFRALGKKVGKLMRQVQQAVQKLDQRSLSILMEGSDVLLEVDGQEIVLTPEDVEVERTVKDGLIAANEGLITIALETELNEALLQEGLAREIVNKINTMRREAGFDVSDRIRVTFDTNQQVRDCYQKYQDYINSEVLAVAVSFAPCSGGEWDLNGNAAKIALQLVR